MIKAHYLWVFRIGNHSGEEKRALVPEDNLKL